jgi:hypothetical protein
MFPYDPTLLAAVQSSPQTISDVVQILEAIASTCTDGDGLKWFNWLYLQVTQAVETRVNTNRFGDSSWIAALDLQFASFYFAAINSSLSGNSTPDAGRPSSPSATSPQLPAFNSRSQE